MFCIVGCILAKTKAVALNPRFLCLAKVNAVLLFGLESRGFLQSTKIKASSLQEAVGWSDNTLKSLTFDFSLLDRNYIFPMDQLIGVMKEGKGMMNWSPTYSEI